MEPNTTYRLSLLVLSCASPIAASPTADSGTRRVERPLLADRGQSAVGDIIAGSAIEVGPPWLFTSNGGRSPGGPVQSGFAGG